MVAIANPIYNNLLGQNLNSTEFELLNGSEEVDFSLTERTWIDTAKAVTLLLLKIVLFPWAIYEVCRWIIQRLIMAPLYPAQSWLIKNCVAKTFLTAGLDRARFDTAQWLKMDNCIVRHVTLEKDGTRLSGLLVGSQATINNGKWVLQAGGNCEAAESTALFATKYQDIDYNLLVMNNPGVGRSKGVATPETIGECQRTAMAFLKTALKAYRIVMAGYSLGGAAIGEAINQYDFETSQTDFLVVRQMTFEKASEMGKKFTERCCILNYLAKHMVIWSGCEMNNLESSKKLSKYNIREIIIQGDSDQVIPHEYSLLKGLSELDQDLLKNKQFQILPNTDHNDGYIVLAATLEHIRTWEEDLDRVEIVV